MVGGRGKTPWPTIEKGKLTETMSDVPEAFEVVLMRTLIAIQDALGCSVDALAGMVGVGHALSCDVGVCDTDAVCAGFVIGALHKLGMTKDQCAGDSGRGLQRHMTKFMTARGREFVRQAVKILRERHLADEYRTRYQSCKRLLAQSDAAPVCSAFDGSTKHEDPMDECGREEFNRALLGILVATRARELAESLCLACAPGAVFGVFECSCSVATTKAVEIYRRRWSLSGVSCATRPL